MLTAGVRDVIHACYEHISQTMTGMFEGHSFAAGTEVTLSEAASQQLIAVGRMLDDYGLDPEALQHCRNALADLDNIYRNIVYWTAVGDLKTGHVWRWPTMVSLGFIRLVQARNSPALVVFAHYAAASSAVKQSWYTSHWGEFALRGVSLELEDDMQHWLDWPREQEHERMAGLNP